MPTNNKIKKLQEDAEDIFFDLIPYRRLPLNVVCAIDSNDFSDHITNKVLSESADYIFNNISSKKKSRIELPLPRQVALHGFLQILLGKGKADALFEEFYSGKGSLLSFFQMFQEA